MLNTAESSLDQAVLRAELGDASARSLLLTMLGEFAYPRGEAVWTSTLLSAFTALGVEEKSARQSTARVAAEGLLSSERAGRRTRWSLTDAGGELLQEGTERIYSFLADAHEWDSQWLLMSVAVPETQRKLRHQLRTQLTWLGMGSPAPGLWVVPDAGVADKVAAVLDGLGLRSSAFVWTGTWAEIGDLQAMIGTAWELDTVAEQYRRFLSVFQPEPLVGADAFAAQVRLVQAWRRFPFLDPDLPQGLLPEDWPGRAAAATFHECHAAWHAQAQVAWAEWVPE